MDSSADSEAFDGHWCVQMSRPAKQEANEDFEVHWSMHPTQDEADAGGERPLKRTRPCESNATDESLSSRCVLLPEQQQESECGDRELCSSGIQSQQEDLLKQEYIPEPDQEGQRKHEMVAHFKREDRLEHGAHRQVQTDQCASKDEVGDVENLLSGVEFSPSHVHRPGKVCPACAKAGLSLEEKCELVFEEEVFRLQNN
eukprot:CAMPEP_0185850558 /NCGR_PEP_ID=MMETSP1354-20130828/4656_1 /TAXON_ID=708628 /ORGANISM="Erythrolobus madagascarensis, Strain CCMP3276" /LENGTH=199 /DNA_ID=CAMNT_0028551257 /DNA_START=374 /DNA_END=970 /DNA_ORIENTATION=+